MCHPSLYAVVVHSLDQLFIILDVNLVDVAVVIVVTPVTRFCLLAPYFNNPASGRVACEKKVYILKTAVSELLSKCAQDSAVVGEAIYLPESFYIFRRLGESSTQCLETHIVYLS